MLSSAPEKVSEKQFHNPLDIPKCLYHGYNDPKITFLNEKSKVVKTSYSCLDEFEQILSTLYFPLS